MEEEMLELIWTNHGPIFRYWFTEHREKERYTDATIGCEGKLYAVHKLVLATCSNYFDEVFEHTEGKHPVLLLHDVKQHELEAILCYMYTGSANVSQLNLTRFMMVAKALQIKGLAVPDGDSNDPLAAMENSQVDNGKGPPSGAYCWRESEQGSPQSLPDSPESRVGSDDDGEEGIEAGIVVKKEQEETQQKADHSESSANQYSFQGFNYKNVEGPDDGDLIKKREVLEKIISQTERPFIRDEKEQAPPSEKIEDNTQQDNTSSLKRENDNDKFVEQKKAVKRDKQSSPGSSSNYLKSNAAKQNLNVQKKTNISKLKASGDYQGRKKHKLSHPVVKSYDCPHCHTSFSRKYALHRHLETHVDVLEFACTYCHAKFPNKEFLTSHMETHDKSKPYLCTLCNCSFSRKDKLTVHVRNHQDEGMSNMTSHVKNFSGKVYVCSECPATFESHDQYVEHSQMHAGEKQFPCTVCPAAFAKKVHLSRHVLTHKGFGSRDKLQDGN